MDRGGRSRLSAAHLLDKAALPGCALLRFAWADMEEGAGNMEGAQQVYEAMAEQLEGEIVTAEDTKDKDDDEGDDERDDERDEDGDRTQEGDRRGASLERDEKQEGEREGEGSRKREEDGQRENSEGKEAMEIDGKAAGSSEGAAAKGGDAEGKENGGEVRVKVEEREGDAGSAGREEAERKREGEGGSRAEDDGKERGGKGRERSPLPRRVGRKREREKERRERRDRRKKEEQRQALDAKLSPYGVEQGALIWVQYMRFLRRTQDPSASRQLFLRARKWQQSSHAIAVAAETAAASSSGQPVSSGEGVGPTGWQVYAAMARMEWASDRSSTAIACRIFEKGLEDQRLAKDPAYTLAYHRFLLDAGDIDNARALFERTLAEPELGSSGELWRAYAAFEYEQGDLSAALQVESRMREAMASTTLDREQREGGSRGESTADLTGMSGTLLQQSLQLALLKYGFEGALPCGVNQQRHIMGTAGMLKGPAPEEEAAIAERYVRQHPEQFEDLVLPPGMHMDVGPSRGDRDGPPGRAPYTSRWEDGPPRDRDARGRRGAPLDRGDMYRERDRDMLHDDLGPPTDKIEQFARDLPPPMAVEGPLVPVEAVMDVIMFYRNTPEAVHYVCTELDAGRVPDGLTGASEGVEVPVIQAMTAPGRRPFMDDIPPHMHDGPPPYGGHPPPPHYADMPYDDMPPPYPGYHGGGPPPPAARKRSRWDGGEPFPPPYQGEHEMRPLPYSYSTPHPSQWRHEPPADRPPRRGRGGRGGRSRDD